MSAFSSCCNTFAQISRAAAKAAAAKLRSAGLLRESVNWASRATVCERCPLRVIKCGVSYCGKPFLQQVERDPVVDGCGCPTRAKARDPREHCPLNTTHQARREHGACDCKWCALNTH
jgi:hypothetical protein